MRCEKCQRRLRRVHRDYVYAESGLRDVIVVGAPVYVCPRHGIQAVVLRNLAGLHEAIASAILHRRRLLRGAEVRFLRKERGWSQAVFAQRLGVHEVTVARWEAGVTPIGAANQQRLRLLFTDPEAFAASQVPPGPSPEAAATIRIPLSRLRAGTRARMRAKRLADASRKVRKESMRVNAEFAAIEQDVDA